MKHFLLRHWQWRLEAWVYVQGILKGEISLYRWPPVWLVWNQLYDNWKCLFLFAKQTNPNQSNWMSTVQWYLPLLYSLVCPWQSFFRLALYLHERLGAYPRMWHCEVLHSGRIRIFVRLVFKNLSESNTLAYLFLLSVTKKKKRFKTFQTETQLCPAAGVNPIKLYILH
jgi:hypothetical protein